MTINNNRRRLTFAMVVCITLATSCMTGCNANETATRGSTTAFVAEMTGYSIEGFDWEYATLQSLPQETQEAYVYCYPASMEDVRTMATEYTSSPIAFNTSGGWYVYYSDEEVITPEGYIEPLPKNLNVKSCFTFK